MRIVKILVLAVLVVSYTLVYVSGSHARVIPIVIDHGQTMNSDTSLGLATVSYPKATSIRLLLKKESELKDRLMPLKTLSDIANSEIRKSIEGYLKFLDVVKQEVIAYESDNVLLRDIPDLQIFLTIEDVWEDMGI